MSSLQTTPYDQIRQDYRIDMLVGGAAKLGQNFSGLGLVFCKRTHVVPHMNIYREKALNSSVDPISFILAQSHKDNSRHDGFHILDQNWRPICLNAYLSPPLLDRPIVNPYNRGSRWFAACLTSRMPGVIACLTIGQASKSASLFANGRVEDVQQHTRILEFSH